MLLSDPAGDGLPIAFIQTEVCLEHVARQVPVRFVRVLPERSEEEEEKKRADKIGLILQRLDEQEERDKKVDLLLEKLQELERRIEGRDAGPDRGRRQK